MKVRNLVPIFIVSNVSPIHLPSFPGNRTESSGKEKITFSEYIKYP